MDGSSGLVGKQKDRFRQLRGQRLFAVILFQHNVFPGEQVRIRVGKFVPGLMSWDIMEMKGTIFRLACRLAHLFRRVIFAPCSAAWFR